MHSFGDYDEIKEISTSHQKIKAKLYLDDSFLNSIQLKPSIITIEALLLVGKKKKTHQILINIELTE